MYKYLRCNQINQETLWYKIQPSFLAKTNLKVRKFRSKFTLNYKSTKIKFEAEKLNVPCWEGPRMSTHWICSALHCG